MAEKPQLAQLLYCGVCGLPAEYCEFGPDFEKCKPWLIRNASDLYPDLLKEGADQLQSSSIMNYRWKCTFRSQSAVDATFEPAFFLIQAVTSWCREPHGERILPTAGPSAPKQEAVKRLPGGKIKKKEKQEVIIEKVTRNKRKSITTLKGLELFGVKLSDASKKLRKKFATGASVIKVPETAIFFIEDGKKVPAV